MLVWSKSVLEWGEQRVLIVKMAIDPVKAHAQAELEAAECVATYPKNLPRLVKMKSWTVLQSGHYEDHAPQSSQPLYR